MESDRKRLGRRPRAGDRALALMLLGALALGASLLHASLGQPDGRLRAEASRDLVRQLQLTGLALFTEARYTRHPALSDRFAPFQNHPMALEHFPSGTLVPPPRHLYD